MFNWIKQCYTKTRGTDLETPRWKAYVDDKQEFGKQIIAALGMNAEEEVTSVTLRLAFDDNAKITIERFISKDETKKFIRVLKSFNIGEKK